MTTWTVTALPSGALLHESAVDIEALAERAPRTVAAIEDAGGWTPEQRRDAFRELERVLS
jgi:hypothetical protein